VLVSDHGVGKKLKIIQEKFYDGTSNDRYYCMNCYYEPKPGKTYMDRQPPDVRDPDYRNPKNVAFVLVYDVNDAASFDMLDVYQTLILVSTDGYPCPFVLCGTMLDLEKQQVDPEKVEKFATKIRACGSHVISSLSEEGVKNVMASIMEGYKAMHGGGGNCVVS